MFYKQAFVGFLNLIELIKLIKIILIICINSDFQINEATIIKRIKSFISESIKFKVSYKNTKDYSHIELKFESCSYLLLLFKQNNYIISELLARQKILHLQMQSYLVYLKVLK